MRIRFIFCILFLSILSGSLAAQEGSYMQRYLLSYPESMVYAIKQPTQWEAEDWFTATGVLAVGVALYFVDENLHEWMHDQQSRCLDVSSSVLENFGDYKLLLPAASLTALGGYIFKDGKVVDTGMMSLKSMLMAGASTRTIQLVSGRNRPLQEQGHGFNFGKSLNWDKDSFPSGHSTLVWSLAPILAQQYGEQSWVAPTVYTLASLTSLSRIYDDKHWASDVFVGAVIGFLSAKVTLKTTPGFGIGIGEAGGLAFVWSF